MAGAAQITQGALQAIFNGEDVRQPILQCVQIKAMEKREGQPERYRVVFSDIRNFIQSMLATQANHVVIDGKLKKGSFVKLNQFHPNTVKNKKVLIILDLDVLTHLGESEKIGEPTALESLKEEEDVKQPASIQSNNFYGVKPEPEQPRPQQHAPSRTNGASSNSSHANLYPIEALSPYAHTWTIKARCTHKSDIKTWHKNNGEGKLFSVNLLDGSGEIRATGFNDQVDMLYEVFQEGGVYYISSPCQVKLAKKQFSTLNNDYELGFMAGTQVEKAEDDGDAPQIRFNFTSIEDLKTVEKDTTIDVIGVLREVGEVAQIIGSKSSKPYDKRELTIVDNTGYSVRLTIWGSSAKSFDAPAESVIAFKGVKVSDFGGRSLSLLASGSMTVDPDIDDAHKLKGWYDAQGKQDNFQSHAGMAGSSGTGSKRSYKTIAQVKDEGLGTTEETAYYDLKASVVFLRQENLYYPACASEKCNKKATQTEVDRWRCEACNLSFPKPDYRFMLSANVGDHTGNMWLTCFDEVGRTVIGMTAEQFHELQENDSRASVNVVAEATCKTYIFNCRAKLETFGDQQRPRYTVSNIRPLNFTVECAKLTDILKQYTLDSDSLFVR
ncbi:replication factor A 1, rfa1 [Patellaria atrata CBS 101060]|uniref:Replication protein A subunit n=1 Tax=Patellaria atrata CBS 101060 TaxID=1346257 RepID=A0A9P4S3J8_9PEZI|nr:replication factor A 1, rfa1 [Patellaria atrata CBS 101060]